VEPPRPDRPRHAAPDRRVLAGQPFAILSQNARSTSRRIGGLPGDRIAGLPVCVTIQPTGRPTTHLLIEVLRRPVDSAQYTAIRYANTLADVDAVASVGSRGDSYDCETVERLLAA